MRFNKIHPHMTKPCANAVATVSEELMAEVRRYVDEHYIAPAVRDEQALRYQHRESFDAAFLESDWDDRDFDEVAPPTHGTGGVAGVGSIVVAKSMSVPLFDAAARLPGFRRRAELDAKLKAMDEPFSASLVRLIDEKGKTDPEVYKKANITRQHFSKIRNGNISPTKKTVLALAVALELGHDETNQLLRKAGFALSNSQYMDVIVDFFIDKGLFNIFAINEVLYAYDQPLLGG